MAEKAGWEKRMLLAGQVCFYLGLVLELLMVVIDKSAYTNPFTGQLFRVTFLLFALKVACSRFSLREWLWLLFFGGLAAVCYLCSGRDEAVRLVVFCAAFQDVDVKKALKLAFWLTLSGCVVLVALAAAGIFGNMYIVDEGDRGIRYCFGLGHPNAFFCMFWVLAALGIYLYHERMKWFHYALAGAAGAVLFVPTNSRTGILILIFTLAFSMLLAYCGKVRESKWMYRAGIMAVLACIVLSVWIACYEKYEGPFYPYDRLFTGRITSMNTWTDGGGMLKNWRLFSRPENTKYFDMGYVRIFYWYGIIPGAAYLVMYLLLMAQCRRKKDYMGFMLLVSFALYTMLEAHFVSVYLGRNYALFLMGAYWTDIVAGGKKQEALPERPREYFWRGWRLFHRGGAENP